VEYEGLTPDSFPTITKGPDGNLWVTEFTSNQIARVTTSGVFTHFSIPTENGRPLQITQGPAGDGALWFTERDGNKIGRIDTDGDITETMQIQDPVLHEGVLSNGPNGITVGPDNNLWFAMWFSNRIGKVTTAGSFTVYDIPLLPSETSSDPNSIIVGPDNNLWFLEPAANKISRITTSGVMTRLDIPTPNSGPVDLITGSDGKIWFTELAGNKIGRFNPSLGPTANAGGPYSISEGQSLTLNASGSSDPDGLSLTYSWDVNGDGTFGDAVGVSPTLTWAQLNALNIKDNETPNGTPRTPLVRVRVQDVLGNISEATTALTVLNTAPTAAIAGPSTGVRGQPLTFTVSATDPSPVDQAAGFEYAINWGDGSPVQTIPRTSGNGSGVSVAHVYTTTGSYTVSVTATDQANLTSQPATLVVTIAAAAIQTDPCDATKTALVVGGTTGNDNLVFSSGGGGVTVTLNGSSLGTFNPTGRILAYGQAGNDDIQVAGGISLPAWLFGDAGNDRLKGGGGANLLVGGEGDDLLVGSGNRDVLIGGAGADRIVGQAEQDLLIAGSTAFDANLAALCAIVDEWNSSRDYATRVANVMGTGSGSGWAARLNGNYFLTVGGTVFDDGARDVLTGSADQDLFFAKLSGSGVLDEITDLNDDEFAADLDFILS
jgi:streptogramin lyase